MIQNIPKNTHYKKPFFYSLLFFHPPVNHPYTVVGYRQGDDGNCHTNTIEILYCLFLSRKPFPQNEWTFLVEFLFVRSRREILCLPNARFVQGL